MIIYINRFNGRLDSNPRQEEGDSMLEATGVCVCKISADFRGAQVV